MASAHGTTSSTSETTLETLSIGSGDLGADDSIEIIINAYADSANSDMYLTIDGSKITLWQNKGAFHQAVVLVHTGTGTNKTAIFSWQANGSQNNLSGGIDIGSSTMAGAYNIVLSGNTDNGGVPLVYGWSVKKV